MALEHRIRGFDAFMDRLGDGPVQGVNDKVMGKRAPKASEAQSENGFMAMMNRSIEAVRRSSGAASRTNDAVEDPFADKSLDNKLGM